jgi:DNA-binding transcriptional LysR family regulator
MERVIEKADWDGIRIYVAVADAGSFRKAAEQLNLSVNTVRRMIERLEQQLGFPLFYREAEGVRLSPEGRRVIMAARDVEKSVIGMLRVAASSADTMAGPIRVAVTEGLGTFWLTPQLVKFIEEMAGQIRIELQCAMRSVDVLRFEADISIQLEEPTNPDLIVKRLGYLFLTPFASKSYLDRFGRPTSFQDLARHRIVEQETDQLKSYNLDELFGAGARDRMVLLKTNFSSAHYWAIAKGAGIGLLPSYARMIGASVEHVDIDYSFRVGIYMACHPEVLKSARHRRFADWLSDSFAADKYPWFGETYIKPGQLEAMFDRAGLAEYFTGLSPERDNAPGRRAIGASDERNAGEAERRRS